MNSQKKMQKADAEILKPGHWSRRAIMVILLTLKNFVIKLRYLGTPPKFNMEPENDGFQ